MGGDFSLVSLFPVPTEDAATWTQTAFPTTNGQSNIDNWLLHIFLWFINRIPKAKFHDILLNTTIMMF